MYNTFSCFRSPASRYRSQCDIKMAAGDLKNGRAKGPELPDRVDLVNFEECKVITVAIYFYRKGTIVTKDSNSTRKISRMLCANSSACNFSPISFHQQSDYVIPIAQLRTRLGRKHAEYYAFR